MFIYRVPESTLDIYHTLSHLHKPGALNPEVSLQGVLKSTDVLWLKQFKGHWCNCRAYDL